MNAILNWEKKCLRDFIKVQNGFAFKSEDYSDEGIAIIRMSDLNNGRINLKNAVRILPEKLKNLSTFLLKPGDFLIGMSGSINNFAIVTNEDLPAYLNQRVGRFLFINEEQADYEFIKQLARSSSYKSHVELLAAGAAQVNISSAQIESFCFHAPPKPEQSKIAEILSTVDRAIEQTEALIAKQQRIKTGLMHDLLTRGIDEHGNLRSEATHKFKDSPLGRIPVEWDHDVGARLFTIRSGFSVAGISRTQEGNALFLKVDDFNDPANAGGLVRSEYTFNCPPSLADSLLQPGTIVFPKRGAAIFLNRVEILKKRGTLDPNLMALIPKSNISSEFIRLMLVYRNLGTICDNSGIPQINNKHLYPLYFIRPSYKEQCDIVERVERSENALMVLITIHRKLQHLKTALMQDLLTGRRRVTALLEQQDEAKI